jgi:hypothetical protein
MRNTFGYPQKHIWEHATMKALSQIELEEGDSMTLTGQRPPCIMCKKYMLKKAEQSKAEIIYQWRGNGKTKKWITKV